MTQPDGGDTAKRQARHQDHRRPQGGRPVDVSGTYNNSFAIGGAAKLPDYRLLAAVIETKDANFYVKLYGPKRTMAAQEKKFLKMIEAFQ